MSTVTPPAGHRPPLAGRRVWDMVKTPLTLLLLLALCWFGFKWGWAALSKPIPQPPPPPCVTTSTARITSSMVTVNVYNGSTERGRATGVANNLLTLKFFVKEVGNTSERIARTIIRGNGASNPEVLLVAGVFVDPVIEADGRVDNTVDVLVGPRDLATVSDDWAGMKQSAPTEAAVPSGAVCLPTPAEQPQ